MESLMKSSAEFDIEKQHLMVQGVLYDLIQGSEWKMTTETGWATISTFSATYFWAGLEAIKAWIGSVGL